MSKPYQFPESSYLNLEPTRQSSAEQHRYAAEQDDEEEIGFSTRNDFNNKPTRNSRLSLAYSDTNGYGYGQKSSSMLLDESVTPVVLSKTDWTAGESKAEMNAPRDARRQEYRDKRRGWGNYWKEGKRWRTLVFVVFGFLIALGLTLFFVIPRAPFFQLLSTTPLTSDDRSPTVSTNPATFSFYANVSLAVDARASYIPIYFTTLDLLLSNLDTSGMVARGSGAGQSVPGRVITPIVIQVLFTPPRGAYSNSSDPTYGAIRAACGPNYPNVVRPTLSLSLAVNMGVRGLIGTTRTATQLSNIPCPVEFAGNAP